MLMYSQSHTSKLSISGELKKLDFVTAVRNTAIRIRKVRSDKIVRQTNQKSNICDEF
jgi:hypothetical protein